MKSKSFFTESPLNLAVAGKLKFGQVLAESYWKIDKKGFYTASNPDTSEILNYWFYNGFLHIEDKKIYLFNWFTGCRVDYYTMSGNINVERIIFKPDESALDDDLMMRALNRVKKDYLSKWAFKTPFIANDREKLK